ncbi:hypothetical protein OQZ33_23085 [Pedobacter sp. MC2016-05]|uniref:FEKKY domain-containing protein n=1 Tax=Pedobacter sp. MC2016-05 TaxID=2994474 RepID=UPI002245A9E7|nr:hypothetical protein [Pedobacter sp. MC2016-05]MCX2477237.1 hypothetical protein [Pedobacter sp. MC2016-05]
MVTTLKILMIALFSLFSILSYGQLKPTDEQVDRSGASKLVFAETLSQAINLANADIIEGIRFLLLKSGISPVVLARDEKFQQDYKIFYYESGCAGPNEKIAIEYNRVMFKHLTQAYGKKWLKNVRKDVLGLKRYN